MFSVLHGLEYLACQNISLHPVAYITMLPVLSSCEKATKNSLFSSLPFFAPFTMQITQAGTYFRFPLRLMLKFTKRLVKKKTPFGFIWFLFLFHRLDQCHWTAEKKKQMFCVTNFRICLFTILLKSSYVPCDIGHSNSVYKYKGMIENTRQLLLCS
jgi:hypothetical protein